MFDTKTTNKPKTSMSSDHSVIPRTKAPPGFQDPIFPKPKVTSQKTIDSKDKSTKPSMEKLVSKLGALSLLKR